MGFWGFEVKPGKPQTCNPNDEQGKIHVTQATLGPGSSKEKSVIQCSIGDKAPIFLCSLMPNKTECCPLNLEFDDDDAPVEFSVTGDRSIHLSGFLEYYQEDEDDCEHDEDASDGIDIGESETDNSCDYDSEEDHLDEFEDFLDSNLEMYRNASAPKSGVVIEEIEDEDEDGLPKEIAHEPENKSGQKLDVDTDKQGSNKKRKAKASEQDVVPESANDSKKKKKQKEKKKAKNASKEEAGEQVHTENTKAQNGNVNNAMNESSKSPAKSAEKKNKKKEKNPTQEATVEKEVSSVRTHPNGLIVEEMSMGKPNGKRADPGKMVSVRYIGKLQKNGKIFDSNIGKSPFKFRLGVGQVIKGWDVGVNGMRVGDKRKLTIPPSMGYGSKGAGGQIPPNAWLTFDVELMNVQ